MGALSRELDREVDMEIHNQDERRQELEDRLNKLSALMPHMSEHDKNALANRLAHEITNGTYSPPTLKQRDQFMTIHDAARDLYNSVQMHGPGDYLKHLGGSIDSLKKVLEFLAAQESMEIFGTDVNAQRIFGRVIQAGIAELFGNNTGRSY